MFNGIEIDMLSLGDADCILLTEWTTRYGPFRVLIDGGSADDAEAIREFLYRRNFTELYAVVCTHPHNDHAKGLIKLAKDRSLTICRAWMHDIRKHVSADALRRASAGNSPEVEGIAQVVQNTEELASAFAGRNITPQEPFAGDSIAAAPFITVLSPSLAFYRRTLEEFTKVQLSQPMRSVFPSSLLGQRTSPLSPLSAYARISAPSFLTPAFSSLSPVLSAPPAGPPVTPANPTPFSSLIGALSESRVKKTPKTQPFNNTSAILGVLFDGQSLLFTSDAGHEALRRVPAEWNHLLWMQVPHHGSDGNLSQRDIERFCPQFANISARGNSSHPSRAVVSGLVKVGARVFSTDNSGNLWFYYGNVPYRADYSPATPLRGTGEPQPVLGWLKFPSGTSR